MQPSTYQRFFHRRESLNEQLAASKTDLDNWLDAHGDAELATTTEMASLGGLLALPRELQTQLAQLDDEFLGYHREIQRKSRLSEGSQGDPWTSLCTMASAS